MMRILRFIVINDYKITLSYHSNTQYIIIIKQTDLSPSASYFFALDSDLISHSFLRFIKDMIS